MIFNRIHLSPLFALFPVFFATGAAFSADFSVLYYQLRQKEIYKFTFELFEAREYYRAITEAKRYISAFPEAENADDLYKLIGDSYMMAEEWDQAIEAYEQCTFLFPQSRYTNQNAFNEAICLVKKHQYKKAKELLKRAAGASEPEIREKSILWRILLLIQENCFKELEDILNDESIRKQIEQEIAIIEKTMYVKKTISYKSPKLAGLMSAVLPGSGQIYNGRYKDATSSFLLNGLFILGAWKAFDDDNPALGAVLTIFEIGWYKGNIYGAVNGAHKYNRKVDEDIFRKSMENFGLLEHEVRTTPNMKIMFHYYF